MDYLNATPVTTTNYIGNFVYNNNIVAYAQSAEGRIVFTSPATVYSESYITDHLGNIRATFKCNTSGQTVLLQTFNYYPFGLRVKGSSEVTYPNEYMYQGKELDNENGLNWYNFHARMYDPILGRWHTPDPAQQYVNPYLAMGNDPVNRIDPDGMSDGDPCSRFSGGINWDKVRNFFKTIGRWFRGNDGEGIITGELMQEFSAGSYNGFFLSADASSLNGGSTMHGGSGGGSGGGSRPETAFDSQYQGNTGNVLTSSVTNDIQRLKPNPYRTVVRGNSNSVGPNYVEKSFYESGFQKSWTSAEGVGAAGGFFYSMSGKVLKDKNGQWYIYASASAWANVAEQQAMSITYFSTITVLENRVPLYTGNLQIWDHDDEKIGLPNFTFIGDGYLPLPSEGTNISVEIKISYNMNQWWNGHAYPKTPYVYSIKF